MRPSTKFLCSFYRKESTWQQLMMLLMVMVLLVPLVPLDISHGKRMLVDFSQAQENQVSLTAGFVLSEQEI